MVAKSSGAGDGEEGEMVVPTPHCCIGVFRVAEATAAGGDGTTTWAYELHDLLARTGESLKPRGGDPSSYARPLGTTAAATAPEEGENGSRNGDDGAAAAQALAARVMELTVHAEGSKLGTKGDRDCARKQGDGSVGGSGITAAPPASPWPLGTEARVPGQEISGDVVAVGSEAEGGAGWLGQQEEDEESAEAEEEMVFDTLMVMSEAMKEEAKAKFQRGDYMGAAKAYRRAAEALDERAAPTADRLEPLRTRLRSLYEKCMCNAAVAGFKAASASPAPGEAHGLVVDTCSKALARCGGRCPKARFWRARVKICQRMYEAAEIDLRKAVEEEEEAKAAEAPQETEDSGSCGGVVTPNGPAPAPDAAAAAPIPKGTSLSPNGTSPTPNGTSSLPPNGTSVLPPSGTTSAPNGTDTNSAAIINPTVSGTGSVGGSSSAVAAEGNGKAKERPSEAARWLAVVRAKIADVSAARALAAEQASAREENAVAGRQRALEVAQRRARYGPGHVPRPPPAGTAVEEGEAGQEEDADAEGAMTSDSSQRRKKETTQEDVVSGWKVPRPPPLKVSNRSPAMVFNDYAMQARFQAPADYEQVTGEDGQAEYLCTISVGPEDRIVGRGRASNMKAAKQQASRELLTNAALAWNEENPEDLIDMETMVPLPAEALSKKSKAAVTEITEEFKAYCAAWVDKVVSEDVHEACFPDGIDKGERKYVHRLVEELNNPAVLSKSATVQGRRRLSVMRKAMMEGMAFMSGDSVIVVDLPAPPTSPADVGDLASITRPPPERKTGATTATTTTAAAAAAAAGDSTVKDASTGGAGGGGASSKAVGTFPGAAAATATAEG